MDSLKVKATPIVKEYMNYSQWHSKFFIFSHTQQKYHEDVLDTIRSELNIIKKNQDSDTHVYSKELLDTVSDTVKTIGTKVCLGCLEKQLSFILNMQK